MCSPDLDLPSRPLLGLAVMGAVLVAVAGLAEIGERRKPAVARLLARIPPFRRPA